jgi:hypothetical protein
MLLVFIIRYWKCVYFQKYMSYSEFVQYVLLYYVNFWNLDLEMIRRRYSLDTESVSIFRSICHILSLYNMCFFIMLISEIWILKWFAGGTPYENGIFRMKLVLSCDFPQSPPKGLTIFCVSFVLIQSLSNCVLSSIWLFRKTNIDLSFTS